MPLTGKYLKYSPEITLEIFTLVWDKLIKSGWSFFEKSDITEAFRQFSIYKYLYDIEVDSKKFNIYSDSNSKTETTVQEILGYDPYVKEKDWSKATKEELLVEAKRRYPIGTKFISANKTTGEIRESIDLPFDFPSENSDIRVYIKSNHAGYSTACIYNGNKWAEIVSLPETNIEVKEVIPEYVECIQELSGYDINSIYTIIDGSVISKNGFMNHNYLAFKKYFKPSTKEAFDAQNQPKSIEKWSIGSYIVFLCDYGGHPKGTVDKIISNNSTYVKTLLPFNGSGNCNLFKDEETQWFATKSEAEEFAKTLIKPMSKLTYFPTEGCCKTTKKELRVYLKDKFPKAGTIWYSKYTIVAWSTNGYWFCQEKSSYKEYTFEQLEPFLPKQPLKQAVHCKTLEEYKFLKQKISIFRENAYSKSNDTVKLDKPNSTWNLDECKDDGYQVLSFQEWCQQNGYVMENKCEFEVGKWYKYNGHIGRFMSYESGLFKVSEYIYVIDKKYHKEEANLGNYSCDSERHLLTDLSEIQQYLPDGYPDKITPVIQQVRDMQSKEFKVGDYVINLDKSISYIVGEICKVSKINKTHLACENKPQDEFSMKPFRYFRHATPEEINNHLISIGQIPELGKQEPEKYPFKKLNPDDLKWEVQSPNPYYGIVFFSEPVPMTKDNWKPKMILSIDDEELPMVNIIKTKSIKQLLNN